MEKEFKASLPFVSSANESRELYSTAVGDFANSGELERLLPSAINKISQVGHDNNFLQQNASNNKLKSGASGYATSLGNKVAQHSMASMQLKPLQLAPPISSAAMSQMNNTSPQTGESQGEQVPKKKILFETCSINQPLNVSLREQCSTGSYYFLK